ncbi:MAG: MarC family protein [Candidatus Omnitrophica bacterium]|nr:MarC family protein [Candidatus Omnitrophota bacterium]
MLKDFFLAFIPIFVAVDAIGILPVFISLSRHLSKKDREKTIIQSLWTALMLALGFIFLGKSIFNFLGITIGDFMIAGGTILFCISIIDLLRPWKERRLPASELGAVPLGTPLIAGPAVLTTSLMLIDTYGIFPTILSVFFNIIIAGILLFSADKFMQTLGQAGSRALSKVFSLLLAAIAVMMVRKGIFKLIASYGSL